MMFSSLVFISILSIIRSTCPPASIVQPCVCLQNISSLTYSIFRAEDHQFHQIQNKSIVCENLSSSFLLRSLFHRIQSYGESIGDLKTIFYDTFLLTNSSYIELPENLFTTIHFRRVMFKNNSFLTKINEKIFVPFENEIEVFESMISNFSNPFSLLRRLTNLRFISLHSNGIRSIPNHAFNHSFLSRIWFGMEYSSYIEPIETIGDFAFSNLPKLYFIRLFSPNLSRITKYSFALEEKTIELKPLLEIHIGGESLHSQSFALTSLTRFRHRDVYIRFYQTKLIYLDENIFQPFLESNPYSSIDLNGNNQFLKCVCQFRWIQEDYFKDRSFDLMDNRVYGYPCWEYDFSSSSSSCSSSIDDVPFA